MAYVDKIWIHDSNRKDQSLTAYVKIKPFGEIPVKFTLPDAFLQCILDAAQAAAELHEQQMKAEILADKTKDA
jgi:hypothetical protein